MAEKSIYDYRVEPHEVDFTLKMTIPDLISTVLNTAGRDALGKGFGVEDLLAGNHSWVLSRMAVEVDRRPEQHEAYRVTTWISEYGRLLSTRNFEILDGDSRPLGRAVTEWAMIDMTSRRAVDLSWVGDSHRDALVDEPSPMAKPVKIRNVIPSEKMIHRVAYSDIDFNRHVNTMRYIDLMFDMLPVELPTCEDPMRFDLHFMKECRYGQTLTVGCEHLDRGARYEISADGEYVALRGAIAWK